MLKHVQISPLRGRSDSLSIRSSTSCSSSLCGSPEPPHDHQPRTPSRTSSFSSLSETIPQTTLKVYTGCLKQDIEYKTLIISWDTTCRDIVGQVLRRCKMRHRDPKLFYLSMEVTIRPSAVQTTLVLDDEARPALLQACHTKGASRFSLQIKPGGLVRVHTAVLQPMSQYKSLMISEVTTCDELLTLLLSCYNLHEPVEQFSLYEVCQVQEYQRKLHPDDLPLQAQFKRKQRGEVCHFLVRRNPNYPRRRQILPSIMEKSCSNLLSDTSKTNQLSSLSLPLAANVTSTASLSPSLPVTATITTMATSAVATTKTIAMCSDTTTNGGSMVKSFSLDSCQMYGDETTSQVEKYFSEMNITRLSSCVDDVDDGFASMTSFIGNSGRDDINRSSTKSTVKDVKSLSVCTKCKNSFRFCEFCMKNSNTSPSDRPQLSNQSNAVLSYNPVYNVREIRVAERNPVAVIRTKDEEFNNNVAAFFRNKHSGNRLSLNLSSASNSVTSSRRNSFVGEAVNTHPASGVGNYVYI